MTQNFPARLLYEELLSRKAAAAFSPEIFLQQRQFIEDPVKFKALLASRRAGKSTTAAAYLIKESLKYADGVSHFIALTRKSAKKILWKELKSLNRKHNLKIKFNNTDLVAEFPNGAEIYLLGGNDEAAIETIRGMKSRLVVIDEAASYRSHLQYLIEEVLTPMLSDYDGTLCILGTPSASCAGPFFDATTGKDPSWRVFKWTVRDNPYMPHIEAWLEAYRKKKGWSEDNPIYLREWWGKWVKSLDSIMYKYDSKINNLAAKPVGKYNHIIGIDVGYGDATAFVVGAYRENDPTFYIVETYKRAGMIIDDESGGVKNTIMNKLRELMSKYDPEKIVMDSGGGGKLVAESFRRRYNIPIKPAQKKDKADFVEQMNSDFYSGRIKVLPGNNALTEEWEIIQWDEDRKREDERFICDLADAALYAWRESPHYTETVPVVPPKVNTEAWYQQQVDEMERRAEEQYRQAVTEEAEYSQQFGDFGDYD